MRGGRVGIDNNRGGWGEKPDSLKFSKTDAIIHGETYQCS
jgi:hypothetical protein